MEQTRGVYIVLDLNKEIMNMQEAGAQGYYRNKHQAYGAVACSLSSQ